MNHKKEVAEQAAPQPENANLQEAGRDADIKTFAQQLKELRSAVFDGNS